MTRARDVANIDGILTAKGDIYAATAAGTPDRLAVGANNTVLTADSATATGVKWAVSGGAPASSQNTVATEQDTTSTSYVDLATVQSTTLTTGTKALVIVTTGMRVSGANTHCYASFAVSGATTLAASDARCVRFYFTNSDIYMRVSSAMLITGLTAGSNTFTMKFKQGGAQNANFFDRQISVIDMGS